MWTWDNPANQHIDTFWGNQSGAVVNIGWPLCCRERQPFPQLVNRLQATSHHVRPDPSQGDWHQWQSKCWVHLAGHQLPWCRSRQHGRLWFQGLLHIEAYQWEVQSDWSWLDWSRQDRSSHGRPWSDQNSQGIVVRAPIPRAPPVWATASWGRLWPVWSNCCSGWRRGRCWDGQWLWGSGGTWAGAGSKGGSLKGWPEDARTLYNRVDVMITVYKGHILWPMRGWI